MIDGAREHKEEIGQTVHIRQHWWLDLVRSQGHDRPLRAPADGARHMQQRTRRAPTGKNESAQRRQLGLEAIDPLFQTQHVLFGDRRFLFALSCFRRRVVLSSCLGGRQSGADRKKVSLQLLDQRSYVTQRFAMGTHNAQTRVELIDIAVGRDARVGFGDTRTAEQGRSTGIARPRVNLHGRQYT